MPKRKFTGDEMSALVNKKPATRQVLRRSPRQKARTIINALNDKKSQVKKEIKNTKALVKSEKHRTCDICAVEKAVDDHFSKFKACDHEPSACRECYSRYAEMRIKDARLTDWPTIQCFKCAQNIPVKQLRNTLTSSASHDLQKLITMNKKASHPNFRWCLNTACGEGQTYLKVPKDNKAKCRKCKAISCFRHQIPWHEGYTCVRYDLSHPDSNMIQSNEEILRRTTKACPGCGIRAEKNGGCNYMSCVRCGQAWYWHTVAFDGEEKADAAEILGESNEDVNAVPIAPLDPDAQQAIDAVNDFINVEAAARREDMRRRQQQEEEERQRNELQRRTVQAIPNNHTMVIDLTQDLGGDADNQIDMSESGYVISERDAEYEDDIFANSTALDDTDAGFYRALHRRMFLLTAMIRNPLIVWANNADNPIDLTND